MKKKSIFTLVVTMIGLLLFLVLGVIGIVYLLLIKYIVLAIILTMVIFAGLITAIIFIFHFRRQDNENEAIVSHVIAGRTIKRPATRSHVGKNGDCIFTSTDKAHEIFHVPHTYPVVMVEHKRDIRADYLNRLLPLEIDADDKPKAVYTHDYDMVKGLTRGKLVTDAVNAMRGTSMDLFLIIVIAVIALVVGIGGTLAVTNAQRSHTTTTTTVTTNTTATQPQPQQPYIVPQTGVK